MRDKRPVDELSIEELERILAIRKREARRARLRSYGGVGRRVADGEEIDVVPRRPRTLEMPATVQELLPADEGDDQAAPAAEPRSRALSADEAPTNVGKPAKKVPSVYFEDEPRFEEEIDPGRAAQRDSLVRGKTLWNRALLGIELMAVLGLVVIFVNLFQALQALSQTTANVQAEYQATANARIVPPTPTPIISVPAVVLPTGHTIKDGVATFNLEEVPIQFRSQYQAFLAQIPEIRPTASPEGPIRIQIPRIGVDSTVYYGDDWESLKLGVAHHIGSGNPGQRGNMVLSAHNDVFGELFRRLDELQPGDPIIVSTLTREYTYSVEPYIDKGQAKGHRLVSPTDTWVMEQPRGDVQQLTLISCYPYRVNDKRIVVFAKMQG